jgi:hypothetical protein
MGVVVGKRFGPGKPASRCADDGQYTRQPRERRGHEAILHLQG